MDIGAFFNTSITGWSAFGGLAIIVVLAVLRGTFIPSKTHIRELQREQQRGDEYRDANQELREQNTALINGLGITTDFFKKVPVKDSNDVPT